MGALVVAVALIAAQIMPAWAGCHSQRHAVSKTLSSNVGAFGHHATAHHATVASDALTASSDKTKPVTKDNCLGNCGCACGLAGMFVFATVVAIDAPLGMTVDRDFAAFDLPLGNQPDGLRRPPRITA